MDFNHAISKENLTEDRKYILSNRYTIDIRKNFRASKLPANCVLLG